MWTKLQLQLIFGPHARKKHRNDIIKRLEKLKLWNGNAKDDVLYKMYDSVCEDNTEKNLNSRKFAFRAFK